MTSFDTFETYDKDRPLFRRLGLKPFSAKTHSSFQVGAVMLPEAVVQISVTGMPAQFWDFRILRNGHSRWYAFRTGSGCLSDFWPHVVAVAEDMFTPVQMGGE